jgi:hypothetical protein
MTTRPRLTLSLQPKKSSGNFRPDGTTYPQHIHRLTSENLGGSTATCCARIHRLPTRLLAPHTTCGRHARARSRYLGRLSKHAARAPMAHARPHPPPLSRAPRLLARLLWRRARRHDRDPRRPLTRILGDGTAGFTRARIQASMRTALRQHSKRPEQTLRRRGNGF